MTDEEIAAEYGASAIWAATCEGECSLSIEAHARDAYHYAAIAAHAAFQARPDLRRE